MAPLSQVNRIGVLRTPLHADSEKLSENERAQTDEPIVLVRFDASEGLSELFNYTVETLSTDPDIDFNKILGQDCSVTIQTLPEPRRVFNGILTAASSLGVVQNDFFGYRLTLRPWPWLLTRTTNCRIFQNKTVVEIIKSVFEASNIASHSFVFETDEDDDFPKLDYCVQYRETDFNFISRLMEKEGIFYYFRHTGDGSSSKHVMVLTDSVSRLQPIRNHEKTTFLPIETSSAGGPEIITDWSRTRQMRSGVIDLNDYNYEKPKAVMRSTKLGENSYEHGDMELYDYPGNYKDRDAGLRYANILLEAEQSLDQRRFATGNAVSLFPGGVTTLSMPTQDDRRLSRKKFPPASEFKTYFVVRALHSYGFQDYRSGGGGSFHTRGSYELQDRSIAFRAPVITPKPRIYGIQTAVIVDKEARGFTDESPEEIEVEKLTEIYVHFYWDRNQSDEKRERRSMKVRCAQLWAGKNWGAQFIPRIGMEVVVQFLEGDPDRPIVTGCVYNDDNQPPYDLPSNKTQSGWKSDSSKNHHGYNELMFEDKKNSELIRMHAQRDHLVQINANQTGYVGATEPSSPYQGGDQTWTVGRNRTWTIQKGNDYLEVKQGNLATDVDMGNYSLDVKMGNLATDVDMGNYSLDVKMGNIAVKAGLGKIEIEAMQSITLKVGQSSIKIDQMGVTIKGIMLSFGGEAMAELKAAMTTVKGDGLLTLKGGLTMIN